MLRLCTFYIIFFFRIGFDHATYGYLHIKHFNEFISENSFPIIIFIHTATRRYLYCTLCCSVVSVDFFPIVDSILYSGDALRFVYKINYTTDM